MIKTLEFSALQVDAKTNSVVFQRYYHLFTREELQSLVAALPGARVIETFYDKSNWCIVFERTIGGRGCEMTWYRY